MSYTYLDGGCFVVRPETLESRATGNWLETPVITRANGAEAVSQFLVEVGPGTTVPRHYPGGDCVLFVLAGEGALLIGNRDFRLGPDLGGYVRPGEAFAVTNSGPDPIRMIVNVCPESQGAEWLSEMPGLFDADFPERTVTVDEAKRQQTSDRYYQLLIGPAQGSGQVTQFIGAIPQSRAADHFHQYEEVITVLRGNGIMWTGDAHTDISTGSMIYLPRQQPHCVECTVASGIELLGLFYPAGSPAVRY